MSDRVRLFAAVSLILLAVFAAYSNSYFGVFVYDDFISIVNNPAIREFHSSVTHTSRPLTNLTFFVQYKLGITHVAEFHAFNLALHALNSVLVWGLLFVLCGDMERNRRQSFSLVAALLWAVHPIHTESVTYIVQRAEILSALFILIGLISGLRFLKTRTKKLIVLVAVAFICASLSKPTAACAPFLLLLFDGFLLSNDIRSALRKNYLLYAAAMMSVILPSLLLLQEHESATSAGFATDVVGTLQYWASQPRIIIMYVGKLLFPRSLLIDYGYDVERSLLVTSVLGLLVAAVSVFSWIMACKGSLVRFALPWIFICLAPVIIVPLSDLFAEHRLYLASIGVSVLVTSILFVLSERYAGGAGSARRACCIMAVVLIASLGCRTWLRNRDYADPEVLWQQVVQSRPLNLRGYLGVGAARARRQDYLGAEASLRMGIDIYNGLSSGFLKKSARTDYAYACWNLASVLAVQGRDSEAAMYSAEAKLNASEIR